MVHFYYIINSVKTKPDTGSSIKTTAVELTSGPRKAICRTLTEIKNTQQKHLRTLVLKGTVS